MSSTPILSTSYLPVVAAILLSMFLPLTAFSYRRLRLKKKGDHFDKILESQQMLKKYIPTSTDIKSEYSAWDYVVPVAYATVLALLGFLVMFDAYDLTIGEKYNLLLSGGYSKPDNQQQYQQLSLLALMAAFLGSYIWSQGNLFRRWSTTDLAPGVYFNTGIRLILASFVALMVRHILIGAPDAVNSVAATVSQQSQGSGEGLMNMAQGFTEMSLPALAFVIGMVPYRWLQFLQTWVSRRAPSFSNDDPFSLDHIQGIETFQKSRLSEEGVDNIQNLAEADMKKLYIRTPFPPGELVDWVGQAKLRLHFGEDTKLLNDVGIRTILNLKTVYGKRTCNQMAQDSNISLSRLETVKEIIENDDGVNSLANVRKAFG